MMPSARAAARSAFLVLFSLAVTAPSAFAQRLLFQRGTVLYAAEIDGSDPRGLFPLGEAPGALLAASPDGRRVVWMVRSAPAEPATTPPAPVSSPAAGAATAAAAPADLESRPAMVFLSDMTGRHQKRLFSTDALRDRRGHKVTVVGADLPGDPDVRSSARQLSQWEPVSLSWSADARTLYLSCRLLSQTVAAKATFAVDAASGAALVDADGRWKSVAPVTDVDARGVILVGAGTAEAAGPAAGAATRRYTPLMLINQAEGTRTTLYSPSASGGAGTGAAVATAETLPDYAFALDPALSGNDNRYIAFTSANKGLWILDRTTSTYRQLLDRNVTHPRWTLSANGLYFLEPRPLADGKTTYDLYSATFAPRTGELAIPQVVLQGVDWFDIVPE